MTDINTLIAEMRADLAYVVSERDRTFAAMLARAEAAEAENERLREQVAKMSDPDMYWAEPDNDYCDHGSFDYANQNPGIVVEYSCARRLPPVYVVTLPEDDENEESMWEEWFYSGATREDALNALAAERVRRAMAAKETDR